MSIISLIVVLLMSPAANAFDDVEYAVTMAKDHLAAGKPEQALKVITDGLEDNPADAQLLVLKKSAQKALSEKKARLAAAEAEKKSQENARKRKMAADREAAEKKAVEEEHRQRPEMLRRALCGCEAQKVKLQAKIRDEQAIASRVGVVNKVTLHEAGQALLNADKAITHIRTKMSQEHVDDLGCEGRMPASEWSTPCHDYLSKYYKEILN